MWNYKKLATKILFDDKVGLFSAIFVAFHPGLLYYDVFDLLPLSMDIFFITCSTLFFLKFKSNPDVWNISLVGVLIGLGFLPQGRSFGSLISLYFL